MVGFGAFHTFIHRDLQILSLDSPKVFESLGFVGIFFMAQAAPKENEQIHPLLEGWRGHLGAEDPGGEAQGGGPPELRRVLRRQVPFRGTDTRATAQSA